jgi:AraC-like DNA-binding protein
MDDVPTDMPFLPIAMELRLENVHTASLARRLHHPCPIAHIGHLPAKTTWVDTRFDVVAFSLILSGTGQLSVDGTAHDVAAPCVICEYPGPRFRYGPHGSWYEVYFTYDGSSAPVLAEIGLYRTGRTLWPIRSVGAIRRMLDELGGLIRDLGRAGNADRVDRMAEWIVSETLLDETERGSDAAHEQVLRVRAHLDEHYAEPVDFRRVARKFGFSFTTFRRHWERHMDKSPARYVKELRMKHACRMLCETSLPIADVAAQLGYDDPLYFSKAFRKYAGTAAREYRRRYALSSAVSRG